MAETSNIEWTDATFNPWQGCTKVSPGCDNCYAEAQDKFRHWTAQGWGAGKPRHRASDATWKLPLKWDADPYFECRDCGQRGTARELVDEPKTCKHLNAKPTRRRVFCASLADVFDNEVPPEWRYDLFNLILSTPSLDWLLLTKRIGNAARMIEETLPAAMKSLPADHPIAWPWPHVWLGATIVNQEEADRDIPKLLATPAAVRFLSCEPLLGPINLRMVAVPPEQDQLRRPWDFEGSKFNALQLHDEDRFHQPPAAIDWVIVGGESGHHARPMHPDWARSLRDQCAAAGVPLLLKQWGEWSPGYAEHGNDLGYDRIVNARQHEWPEGHCSFRVGKKAAGRQLDGVEHNGFPEVQ